MSFLCSNARWDVCFHDAWLHTRLLILSCTYYEHITGTRTSTELLKALQGWRYLRRLRLGLNWASAWRDLHCFDRGDQRETLQSWGYLLSLSTSNHQAQQWRRHVGAAISCLQTPLREGQSCVKRQCERLVLHEVCFSCLYRGRSRRVVAKFSNKQNNKQKIQSAVWLWFDLPHSH